MGLKIALDAFGGDHCPYVEVEAAVLAARAGQEVILVGDRARLVPQLALLGITRYEGEDGITVHHASDVITMDDVPSKVVRSKPDASMLVCFDLVRRGAAAAVVSAGNSGAMLACGLFRFGRIKGIDRPAIVSSFPRPTGGPCVLIDMGANVECKPVNLVQFAVMGAIFSRTVHGNARPRVGVLSNGSEEGKGTELTRATHRLLSSHPSPAFTFVGNVEGKDFFRDTVDVIVTDGFTGNVALKVLEATAGGIVGFFKAAVMRTARTRLGALVLRPAFRELAVQIDPETYGGAPLLGVDGVAIICHGGAGPKALAAGVRIAADYAARDLTPALRAAVAEHRELFADAKREEAPV
ncbi:MAG TPA: phosphate acyltransferase PlsX [Nannocystis sp.]